MKRGSNWMIQFSYNYGPVNFGIHFNPIHEYVDIHLPFTIITLGRTSDVEYPPGVWFDSRMYHYYKCSHCGYEDKPR